MAGTGKRSNAALTADLRRWRQMDFFALCLEARCLLSAIRINELRDQLSSEILADAEAVRNLILDAMEAEARERNDAAHHA